MSLYSIPPIVHEHVYLFHRDVPVISFSTFLLYAGIRATCEYKSNARAYIQIHVMLPLTNITAPAAFHFCTNFKRSHLHVIISRWIIIPIATTTTTTTTRCTETSRVEVIWSARREHACNEYKLLTMHSTHTISWHYISFWPRACYIYI